MVAVKSGPIADPSKNSKAGLIDAALSTLLLRLPSHAREIHAPIDVTGKDHVVQWWPGEENLVIAYQNQIHVHNVHLRWTVNN